MKPLFLCLFFVLNTTLIEATPKTNKDSLVNSKLVAIEQYHKVYADSMQRELTIYKAKEAFFSEALNDQSTRFSLIIAGLLTIAGLISWGWIWNLFRKQKFEILELKQGFKKDLEEKINIMENIIDKNSMELYQTQDRLNWVLFTSFSEKQDFQSAFNFAFSSIISNRRIYDLDMKNNLTENALGHIKEIESRMKAAHMQLERMVTSDYVVQPDWWEETYRRIDEFKSPTSPIIDNYLSRCKVLMRKIKTS